MDIEKRIMELKLSRAFDESNEKDDRRQMKFFGECLIEQVGWTAEDVENWKWNKYKSMVG